MPCWRSAPGSAGIPAGQTYSAFTKPPLSPGLSTRCSTERISLRAPQDLEQLPERPRVPGRPSRIEPLADGDGAVYLVIAPLFRAGSEQIQCPHRIGPSVRNLFLDSLDMLEQTRQASDSLGVSDQPILEHRDLEDDLQVHRRRQIPQERLGFPFHGLNQLAGAVKPRLLVDQDDDEFSTLVQQDRKLLLATRAICPGGAMGCMPQRSGFRIWCGAPSRGRTCGRPWNSASPSTSTPIFMN